MPMVDLNDLLVQKGKTVICQVPRLTVEAGERVLLAGDNGSGKTTLLRTVASSRSISLASSLIGQLSNKCSVVVIDKPGCSSYLVVHLGEVSTLPLF